MFLQKLRLPINFFTHKTLKHIFTIETIFTVYSPRNPANNTHGEYENIWEDNSKGEKKCLFYNDFIEFC